MPWSRVSWVERAALAGLLASTAAMGLGTAWDIQWHAALNIMGSEPFWSPPHRLLYSGAVIPGIVGFVILLLRLAGGRAPAALGFLRAPGYAFIGVGSAIMVAGAGFDAYWHYTIGDLTIWSPPHVVAVAGAITIAQGIVIALLNTGRRDVLPDSWVKVSAGYLLASMVVAAYAALLPAALVSFLPDVTGLRFYTMSSPYLASALAGLIVPAAVTCYQVLLGRYGFDLVALAAAGLWVLQKAFHLLVTPGLAVAQGHSLKDQVVPEVGFELLTLVLMLLPPLLVGRPQGRLPWVTGALIGTLYAVEVTLLLVILHRPPSPFVLPAAVAGAIGLGAMSATFGTFWGRWLRRESSPDGRGAPPMPA